MLIISPELLAAIQGNFPPAIDLVFHDRDDNNTVDFSLVNDATNRIMDIQWHEKMYDGYGFIALRNNDLAVPDLRGWWVEPGFGADTSDFGGSGNETAKRARMWVANQQYITAPGKQKVMLILEDVWRRLARHLVLALGGAPRHYNEPWTHNTVYEILEYLIETNLGDFDRAYMASTLDALGDQDDGIIDTLTPYIDFNIHSLEPSLEIMQRVLNLTKCYLRARASLNFEVRYPQDSDAVDATYYSDQVPYFHEYIESNSVLVPNYVKFYGDYDEETGFFGLVSTVDEVAENEEKVINTIELAQVESQGELDIYVNAYVERIKNRRVGGRMIIRLDPRLELHDKIRAEDNR